MLSKKNIYEVFLTLSKLIDNPKTELLYTNHFTLLVAVVLSAQATDKGVNKATESLFKVVNTPQDVIEMGEDKLIDYIKSIGLYKTKAKNIIKLSQDLIDKFNSIVPSNFEDLISLAGVGRKTANVVLSEAFGEHTIAVDTHVFRVSKRLGISKGNTVYEVEQDLLKKVPVEFKKDAHHLLILHGRYTCKAKGYNCRECNLISVCEFKDKIIKEI